MKMKKWDGVKITDKTANEWVKELHAKMKRYPDDPYHFLSSGDRMVVAFRTDNPKMVEYYDCKIINKGSELE